ncbi:MAG: TonB-dependent receptor [Opitutaceae bacterium]|nr:TonB-dependent receptor [Opitutaceae bacterium]
MTALSKCPTRGLIAALLFGLVSLVAEAGDVTGVISDGNTRGLLPGATVEIVETGARANTDENGVYYFRDLGPGSYTLRVTYLGYEAKSQTLEVADGVSRLNMQLGSDVVEMEALTVEGLREGRSKALQQKRVSQNVMDLISADSVGNLPDRNVADALSRLPGLNIDVSSGEGRFVTIRGIDPNLNNVTLNGATLAAPGVDGRSGRSMPLDVIGSSQISQVEVVKTLTPDMDGNALGGSINIRSASGFDREGRFIFGSVEVGDNRASDDGSLYGADITYGNVFGADKTVGLALSASYSNRPYRSDEVQGDWDQLNSGEWWLTQYELHPLHGERERLGFNLNLEVRPDEGSEYYVRAIYNTFDETRDYQQLIMETRRDPVFISPNVATHNRMRFERRAYHDDREQTLTNVTAGGKKRFDALTLSGDVTYSFAEENHPNFNSVQYRSGNINQPGGDLFQFDYTGFYPTFSENRLNATTPADFPLRRFVQDTSVVEEDTVTARADAQWDFTNLFGGRKGFFKGGLKYTSRDRSVNDNSVRPTAGLSLATIGGFGPGESLFDGRYRTDGNINLAQNFAYLAANGSSFTIDSTESAINSVEDDYDINEDILAFYLMGNLELNARTTLILGARMELTDASIVGYEARTANGSFLGIFRNKGTFDYDNILPNAQVRFAVSDNLILRAAVTGSMGRPAYEDAAPISTFEYDPVLAPLDPAYPFSGSLEIGNPTLSPYESVNFDVSLEYYLESGGLLSIAAFRKEIDNPIYRLNYTQRNTTYNGVALERLDVTSLRNAESGRVTGVELTAQVPFSTFLGKGVLAGFGIDANASFISSSAEVFDRPDELPFFRQPDLIYNAGLYYQGYGWTFRAAYNYQAESIRELGNNAGTDFWSGDRYSLDLQLAYNINDRFSVYANWKNVTDQPTEIYFGDKNRIRVAEFFGSDVRVGVRFNF